MISCNLLNVTGMLTVARERYASLQDSAAVASHGGGS